LIWNAFLLILHQVLRPIPGLDALTLSAELPKRHLGICTPAMTRDDLFRCQGVVHPDRAVLLAAPMHCSGRMI
jgi:hypothetical protein